MKYKLLILCLAVCQLAFAQDKAMTLDSLKKMNPVKFTICQDNESLLIQSYKDADFKIDPNQNYILQADCNVITFNKNTNGVTYKTQPKIFCNDTIRIFRYLKSAVVEDTDTTYHCINDEEETYVLIDTIGSHPMDTLACIRIGTKKQKKDARKFFVIKPEVKIDSATVVSTANANGSTEEPKENRSLLEIILISLVLLMAAVAVVLVIMYLLKTAKKSKNNDDKPEIDTKEKKSSEKAKKAETSAKEKEGKETDEIMEFPKDDTVKEEEKNGKTDAAKVKEDKKEQDKKEEKAPIDDKKESVELNNGLENKIKELTELNAELAAAKEKLEGEKDKVMKENTDLLEKNKKLAADKEELEKLRDKEDKAHLQVLENQKVQFEKAKQDELAKVEEKHKKALQLKQNELDKAEKEHEAAMKQKQEELAKAEEEHEKALQLKQDALDKAEKDHEIALQKKQEEFEEEKAQIKASIETDKAELVKLLQNSLNALEPQIESMNSAVENEDSNNVVKYFAESIVYGFRSAKSSLEELAAKADEYPSYGDMLKALRKKNTLEWLSEGGLANMVYILSAYCRIPQVADVMTANGINTAAVAYIQMQLTAILGSVGISVSTPNLLVDKYDKEYHEYYNMETRINLVCPNLSAQDYLGKVFDLAEVGYVVSGEVKKPKVKYF